MKNRSKKEKVECPACGRKFKTNSGNIPEHKAKYWNSFGSNTSESGNCNQNKSPFAPTTIVNKIDKVIINDCEVKAGDKVAFTTYPWKLNFQDWNELKEHTIANIYLMDNGKNYLELENIKDEYVPVNIFVKNFIKL